jgi:hypothetical protein
VSWEDAQLFLEELNKREKQAGWVYRLPREAEWEYACRGGLSTKLANSFDFYLEKPTNQLQPEQANFGHGTGLKRTCKVGSYKPNRLGLYDMHGNVMEWCQDEFKDDKGASQRVIRGGSWLHGADVARAGHRGGFLPSMRSIDFGLRLARVPIGNGKLSDGKISDLNWDGLRIDSERSFGNNKRLIGSVERGERNLSILNLRLIADILRVSLADLLHGLK